MRNLFFCCLLFACVSAVPVQEDRWCATCSMTIDGVSLTLRVPTRNQLDKPIVVAVTLKQEDGNPPEASQNPCDLTVRGDDGQTVTIAVTDNVRDSSAPDRGNDSGQKQYDLSKEIHKAGHYYLTAWRELDEGTNNWKVLEIRDVSFFVGPADDPSISKGK
jgi:hypothetical protein